MHKHSFTQTLLDTHTITHTHTQHTHTHKHTHTHTHKHTHTHSLSLSLSHTHTNKYIVFTEQTNMDIYRQTHNIVKDQIAE